MTGGSAGGRKESGVSTIRAEAMEYKVHCASSDTALSQGLAPLVEQHVHHVDRFTRKFPVRSLLVSGERHRGGHTFEVKASLVLENNALSTSSFSPYLESAVSLAFRKLLRQVRILKEALRRSRTYERVRALKESLPNPSEIAALAAELEERVARQDFLGFRNRLTDLLPRLERFVRRELRFHEGGEPLRGKGEIAREIVEEALLHTYEKFQEKPSGLHPEKWIFRHALDLVDIYVANAKEELLENEWTARQDGSRTGSEPDEEERSQEEMIDELEGFPLEVVDFDAITAPEPDRGENGSEGKDLTLGDAIESLPEDERKALCLCFMDGFRPLEAAVVLNCSEERVRHLIDQGATRLRGIFRAEFST